MYFDPNNLTLLEPVQQGDNLVFKSNKTGATHAAKPQNTLLAHGTESEINISEKYKFALKCAPYDSANPIELTSGCPKCKRKLIRFRQLGENKEVIFSCLCGYIGKIN